jgi:hypothetical protein
MISTYTQYRTRKGRSTARSPAVMNVPEIVGVHLDTVVIEAPDRANAPRYRHIENAVIEYLQIPFMSPPIATVFRTFESHYTIKDKVDIHITHIPAVNHRPQSSRMSREGHAAVFSEGEDHQGVLNARHCGRGPKLRKVRTSGDPPYTNT